MELRTPRLLLRDLRSDDAAALNEIDRDERVTRYMSFDPQTLPQTREYIASDLQHQAQQPRRVYDLAIVPGGETAMIGRVGLEVRRPEHREAVLWYSLHPARWGRGHATEAAAALVDFAFGSLALHRVWADCDPRNAASCRVALRLGMSLEGRLRENYWLKGEWCDTAVYAVLKHEWAQHRTERRGTPAT